jgi:8-oxo-dGTP diphosphatase
VTESTIVSAPEAKTRPRPTHVALAVVLQIREARLQVLLWERARRPFLGAWALPGGYLEPDETLEQSIRRHLAAKVDVREVAHLEQLATLSDPARTPVECDRLRAKLSYTNVGFALAPPTFTISELRDLYAAALGHDVSATNLQRVLLRRGVLEPTGTRREPGPGGGRPAACFRFRSRRLEITDEFAVLRPPAR